MSGISARHGGHQVAQKFNMTRCPRNSDNLRLSPSNVASSKSGAMSPTWRPIESKSIIPVLLVVVLVSSETSYSFALRAESFDLLTKSYIAQENIPTIRVMSIVFFNFNTSIYYPQLISHVSFIN